MTRNKLLKLIIDAEAAEAKAGAEASDHKRLYAKTFGKYKQNQHVKYFYGELVRYGIIKHPTYCVHDGIFYLIKQTKKDFTEFSGWHNKGFNHIVEDDIIY